MTRERQILVLAAVGASVLLVVFVLFGLIEGSGR